MSIEKHEIFLVISAAVAHTFALYLLGLVSGEAAPKHESAPGNRLNPYSEAASLGCGFFNWRAC
jgi:hypothetical protein